MDSGVQVEKNLQSVGCCKKERKNNEKKPARAVLPGSPRGPGEPCHPAGVPAHNPVKLTTRLSSRTRVPTIKPPPSEPLPIAAGAPRPGTWWYESSFLAKHCGRFGELPTAKWGNLTHPLLMTSWTSYIYLSTLLMTSMTSLKKKKGFFF